ncbi:MAG: SsrA-binding protein SmpB [Deltaproteobacteria bacterium]|nr:SsrA-binding protein SmpB [Deltaproteobacteria bacterium]
MNRENKPGVRTITTNRKAFHEYEILEKWEAGIALLGTEVKSIRAGNITLGDGWVDFSKDHEAILRQVNINPYLYGNIQNHEPQRPRQLLLKKSEIKKLSEFVTQQGLTVVPLRVFIKGQRIKIEIGLARGKKLYDKREAKKAQEAARELERSRQK